MTCDTNGWTDAPELERETLEQWERPCGKRLVESRERIGHLTDRVRRTRLRIAETKACMTRIREARA